MKRFHIEILILIGFCLFSATACLKKSSADGQISEYEKNLVAISDGVIQLFETDPDGIWPGYDLSSQPFIFYLAPKWVLFFNAPGDVPGFGPLPDYWPIRPDNVLYYQGRYEGLAGQLAFNFEIAGTKLIAVAMPEEPPPGADPEVRLFAHLVHEVFHQYQFGHFGEIPWAREERYPILDRENSALAYLEMRILMDAVEASASGDKKLRRDLLSLFTAVRSFRWREEGSFITRYEQGQEINEGTARYVEMKCLDAFHSLLKGKKLKGPAAFLAKPFASLSFPAHLLEDFRNRMEDNHIAPGDMLRNRIYPVGSALGFLADDLGIDWKPQAQEAGTGFAFHRLFVDALALDEKDFAADLERAKVLYDYAKVLAATEDSVRTYSQGFEQDLEAFEDQEGIRIELDFSYRGLSRSRSSLGKKWVMDSGETCLCMKYRVYTLKSEGLLLEVHDAGMLEGDDWDGKQKTVSFYVPAISSITLDDKAFDGDGGAGFTTLEIHGEGVNIKLDKPGRLRMEDRRIQVVLDR